MAEEFDEGEVWDVMNKEIKVETSPKSSRRRSKDVNATKKFPKANVETGEGSSGTSSSKSTCSAPVSIPDWSKIYRSGHGHGNEKEEEEDDDDNDDDDDDKAVPPHEWVAKKLARSRISSPSVCEGTGRTLKGRDLSRVRNDVLSRTGFLE